MLTVGERIKNRRIELGLSQEELAKRAKYAGKPAISKFENAGNDITMKQVYRLATALETTPAYLMGWESSVAPEKKPEPAEEPNIELMRKALELYNQYANASPDIRNAVELLLTTPRSDS